MNINVDMLIDINDRIVICYHQINKFNDIKEKMFSLNTNDYIKEQLSNSNNEIKRLDEEYNQVLYKVRQWYKENKNLINYLENMKSIKGDGKSSRADYLLQKLSKFRHTNKSLSSKSDKLYKMDLFQPTARRNELEFNQFSLKALKKLAQLQMNYSLGMTKIFLKVVNPKKKKKCFFKLSNTLPELEPRNWSLSDFNSLDQQTHILQAEVDEMLRDILQQNETHRETQAQFQAKLQEQNVYKQELMESIHEIRQTIDALDQENDRIIGSIVKCDPTFIQTEEFKYFQSPFRDLNNDYKHNGKSANEEHLSDTSNELPSLNIKSSANPKKKRQYSKSLEPHQSSGKGALSLSNRTRDAFVKATTQQLQAHGDEFNNNNKTKNEHRAFLRVDKHDNYPDTSD